jgi:hypothetical protein
MAFADRDLAPRNVTVTGIRGKEEGDYLPAYVQLVHHELMLDCY